MAQAILANNKIKLEKLLNEGADVTELKIGATTFTTLAFAAGVGNIDLINVLLERGANAYYQAPYEIALSHGFPAIAKLLPKCVGTRWLTQFCRALDYPFYSDYKLGLCLGLGAMARQAFKLNDIKNFNDRLNFMYAIFQTAENIFRKKYKIDYDCNLLDDDFDYNNKAMGEKIREKIKSSVEHINNSSLKAKIHAFCSGLVLYQVSQCPDKLSYLLQDYSKTKSSYQRMQHVFNLVKPIAMEQVEDNDHVGHFTGAYYLNELGLFFQLLSNKISEASFSGLVSFALSNSDHTVEVSYDNKNKIWYWSDTIPIRGIESSIELAKAVAYAFKSYHCAIFATVPSASPGENKKLHHLMEDLWQDLDWQKIHAITTEKAYLKTAHDDTWRNIAIGYGDPLTYIEINQLLGPLAQSKSALIFGVVFGIALSMSGVGTLAAIAGSVAMAKLTKCMINTFECAAATKNSLVTSSLPQQPLENVAKIEKTSVSKSYYMNFFGAWKQHHAAEDKIGTMLQSRILKM